MPKPTSANQVGENDLMHLLWRLSSLDKDWCFVQYFSSDSIDSAVAWIDDSLKITGRVNDEQRSQKLAYLESMLKLRIAEKDLRMRLENSSQGWHCQVNRPENIPPTPRIWSDPEPCIAVLWAYVECLEAS